MELNRHCFAVTGLAHETGFSVNAGFVTGDGETLIIDSAFNYLSAQTILGYAKASARKNKIKYLVNTEIHFDHTLGNSVFKEAGAEIIACNKAAYDTYASVGWMIDKMNESLSLDLKNQKDPNKGEKFFANTVVCDPDKFIEKDTTLNVGGIEAKLILTPGHTDTNISVYIPEEKVIFVGDLIYSGYLPTLRFGNQRLWEQWIGSLEKLRGLEIEILVPGHGLICKKKEAHEEIERHKKFLTAAISGNREWWKT
jgi:glyoxylase-like metal-dependent hydrolase (beta-lactamase superfamily II)